MPSTGPISGRPPVAFLRALCLSFVLFSLGGCSDDEGSEARSWGETCVREYAGKFAVDASNPEQSCVDLVNQYRDLLGKPELSRWTAAEACTAQQVEADAVANDAHGNFNDCDELAQNTCIGSPSIEGVLGGCLLAMYCEGPSPSGAWDNAHGHHMNMTSSSYTQVACGFHQLDDGRYWANINFR